MTKKRGSGRQLKANSSEWRKRVAEIGSMRESGKYSSVEMGKNGGYLAIEKGKAKHKPEEIEAGKILADKGYKVILKDETGHVTTPEGYIFSSKFEQITPSSDPKVRRGAEGFKRKLEHSSRKVGKGENIDVPVIYDKNGVFTKKDVEEGIKLYESYWKRIRFKEIIVISSRGRIHVHHHNN